MSRVKFTIDVDIEERWVDEFCSFLRYLQFCGDVGHSCIVGFNADGNRDFKANFDIKTDFVLTDGYMNVFHNAVMKDANKIQTKKGESLPYVSSFNVERVFDAD